MVLNMQLKGWNTGLGLSLFLLLGTSIFGQEKINWISWEEALQKQEQEPKKIMIDLYTDWCGWCKKMDKHTFSDSMVATYVNNFYYAVKFDAEQKSTLMYKGKEYEFVKGGRRGYHTLAGELTRGKLSYPTTVFLDEKSNIIQPLEGYFGPADFEMILSYFGENFYQTTSWKSYTYMYKDKDFIRNANVPKVKGTLVNQRRN